MKKRVLSFLLTLSMLLSLLPAVTLPAAAVPNYADSGSGKSNDPYIIKTIQQLENLSAAILDNTANWLKTTDMYFKLANDIGSADKPFTKTFGCSGRPFYGHFDGAGHTIYVSLSSSMPQYGGQTSWVALFPQLYARRGSERNETNNGATICNLTVKGTINITSGEIYVANTAAAGICAYNQFGVISNCTNLATINVNIPGIVENYFGNVGGICGYNLGGEIINCTNSGAITMSNKEVSKTDNKYYYSYIGGICGHNEKHFFYSDAQELAEAVILNCVNTAAITGSNVTDCFGGVCGNNERGYLINCINRGEVSRAESETGYLSLTNNFAGICGDTITQNEDIIANRRYVNCYSDASKCTNGPLVSVHSDNERYFVYNLKAMPAAQMKTASGSTYNGADKVLSGKALVDLLNDFITNPAVDGNLKFTNDVKLSTAITKNWFKWKIGSSGYPELVPEFKITLDNQSPTTAGSTSVTATYGSAMPTITLPQKTGYTFGGYYTDKNGGGTQYYKAGGASAKNSDFLGEATLYAKWTANTYTVTLNAQDGTGGTGSVTATYGSAMPTDSVTMPTRTGYAFAGYYDTDEATGGNMYYKANGASNASWNKTGDTTLYARWVVNTHTVKFDKNVDPSIEVTDVPSGDLTVKYNEAASLPETEPARTDWTFIGWDTKADGTGYRYDAGTSIHAANSANVGVENKYFYTTLDTETGKETTLYAIWQKDVAYRGAYDAANKTNRFDKFANAVSGQSSGTIYLHAIPLAKEENVSVNSGVTIVLYNNAGQITTTAPSSFNYHPDGTLELLSGTVSADPDKDTTIYVDIPDDANNPHKVVIKQDGNGTPVAVRYSADSPYNPIIENAGTGDEVTVDGTKYTGGGTPSTITLAKPPLPFPGATEVVIPKGIIETVSVDPEGGAPTVGTPAKTDEPAKGSNTGSVTIKSGATGGYPVTVTVGTSEDKVSIDPDGTGSNAVTYTTTEAGTELEVDKDGKATLTKGGVALDPGTPSGESIYIKNPVADEPDVQIANAAASGDPVTVTADETDGGEPYTIVIPKTGSVTIGEAPNATTYTNPSSSATTTLTVDFDDDGNPIVTLTGGTADVPTGGKIIVDGDTITNNTGTPGNDIRVKAHGDAGDGVDITVPATGGTEKTVTTKGNVSVGPVGTPGGEIVLTPAVGGSVFVPGAVTVDVQIKDETGDDPDVTVDKDSTGAVTVERTSSGFDVIVDNDSTEASTVKLGDTKYTIPTNKDAELTIDEDGNTLKSGAVELDKDEVIVIEGVTVKNTMTATTLTAANGISTTDGRIELTVGTDTLHYYRGDGNTTSDLVFLAQTDTALNVSLDDEKETLTVDGAVTADVNVFTGDSDNTATATPVVSVKAASAGKVEIANNSYDVTVTNGAGESSKVKVGKYTYTVPANTTTVLSAASDTETAKLNSGTVELDKTDSEAVIIPTAKPYTIQNVTTGSVTTPITVSKTAEQQGANIEVPSGAAFKVKDKTYTTAANSGITTTYVTDGSGNVKVAAGENAGDPEHGVKLKLDMGKVELTPSQTIYANVPAPGGKLISNPNESGTLPVDAGDGEVDTVIALTKDQSVDIGGTLLNGTITGTTRYTALSASAELALDKTNPIIPDGTVLIKSGQFELGAGGTLGVTGAASNFKISVPTSEDVKPISVAFTDNSTPDDTTDDGVNVTVPAGGEFTVTVEGSPVKTYTYVNHSASPVIVPIKNDGTLRTVLKDAVAPKHLPAVPVGLSTPSYEGYCQSVNDNTTTYYFEDDLDTLLSKAYLDNLSGSDTNMDKANKSIKNTVVLNTAVNPTTTGYILTQNCVDIYTAQGNLAGAADNENIAYAAVTSPSPALYTVDSRERSQQYVGDQSIANDVTSCMVVKISNESGEPGHVEVQAGEAKIKWSETDTTYYVTLTDALIDAANNADTSLNQYNKHDGKGTAQTIIMNINPYGDRTDMKLEKGDKLVVRGEDVSKEGDSFTAITDAAITMYEGSNDVYLASGTLRADVNSASGDDGIVTAYVGEKDTGYYAMSVSTIHVTGGETSEADTFAEIIGAATVKTTTDGQKVTVGIGGNSKTDKAVFTAVTAETSYPICRVGKLDNKDDKVVVEGSDTTDYTVYSLVEKYVSPYTPRAEYATVTVSGANTGDTTIINGVETNKISTVVVKSAKANDTFTLLMPREQTPAAYLVAEDNTDATFKTQYNLQLTSGGFAFVGKQVYTVNGVSYNGKEADAGYKVGHRTGVATVNICDELYAIGAGKTVYVNYGTSGQSVKYGDKTYTSTNSTAGIVVPGKTKEVDPGAGSYIYVDRKDTTEKHFYVQGPTSDDSYNVPVSGNGNSVKVSASVSGSTATVQNIKDADLDKVTGGEAVEIDLTGLKKDIDTAKISTETVEKIGEQTGMSVKLSTATVEFDKTATQEIVKQADGNTIELVVDDIKEVSLNAVQKEAVGKLDTALIIDAYLVSNGVRLCSESKGGFGGGKATVTLPFEIKNNRTAANYSVFYVDDAGNLEKLAAKYDTELSAFVFDIMHFSNYVVSFDENAMPFVDVPANEYFYDAVKWAVTNGITDGTDATHFSPESPVTRAQVVTFLWRAAGCPEPVGTSNKFTDLLADQYYIKAVAWAIEQGITKGITETTFEPETVCTRGQIVTFLARFAGVKDADTMSVFSDVPASEFFAAAVKWAKDNGVTSGVTETTFEPYTNCNRAQVVTFLYRWMVK